jgi:hypothetical protein
MCLDILGPALPPVSKAFMGQEHPFAMWMNRCRVLASNTKDGKI